MKVAATAGLGDLPSVKSGAPSSFFAGTCATRGLGTVGGRTGRSTTVSLIGRWKGTLSVGGGGGGSEENS